MLPTLVSSLGLGLVASVLWPMASYTLSLKFKNDNSNNLLSPITYESFANENGKTNTDPTLIADIDYTKASNWFTFSPSDNPVAPPQSQSQFINLNGKPSVLTQRPTRELQYQLSIPSLGIKDATVNSATDDLTKSLVQYQQTAYPGEAGSPVIFGHSTLPQFFNPNNYLTIFAILPTIKMGDDIFVDYAGVKYTYRVSNLYEVKPSEFWVLKQDYTKKILKLITCVPPGTKLRRLVVEAELLKS